MTDFLSSIPLKPEGGLNGARGPAFRPGPEGPCFFEAGFRGVNVAAPSVVCSLQLRRRLARGESRCCLRDCALASAAMFQGLKPGGWDIFGTAEAVP